MKGLRIVIQARMTSSRLPGKALMPLAGIPSVSLAGLRAARNGAETVVATSIDPTDDPLAEALSTHGLNCVRGSLDEVLSRCILATADLSDDAVVVRLTGDNVFPDAEFIEELVNHFHAIGGNYVGALSEESFLPYGMCGEAFFLGALRRADENATSAEDRGEFVTPWLKRTYGTPKITNFGFEKNLSHLRCTIDTSEDYNRVAKVFSMVDDPVGVSWRRLCDLLAVVCGEESREG